MQAVFFACCGNDWDTSCLKGVYNPESTAIRKPAFSLLKIFFRTSLLYMQPCRDLSDVDGSSPEEEERRGCCIPSGGQAANGNEGDIDGPQRRFRDVSLL